MRGGVAVTLAAVAGLLLGCGSGGDEPAARSDGQDARSSAAPSPSPSPRPTGPSLPTTCAGVLRLDEIDGIVGQKLVGSTSYIRGVPEPKIGRLERVNCRYGVRAGVVPIDVGLSTYGTPEQASGRVQATVDQERATGSAPSTVQLGDMEATVLTGPNATLLVVAREDLTVAVTVSGRLAAGDRAKGMATAITGKVLEHLEAIDN